MDSKNSSVVSDSNLFPNESSMQMNTDENIIDSNMPAAMNDSIQPETSNDQQQQENANNNDNINNNDLDNEPAFSTAGQQLIDFLQYLEDYKPTVPDSVTSHIMHTAGFNTSDTRIIRLASLASQKFIADIANDAFQHCKMRTALSQNKKAPKDKRYTLTFEDLVPVLSEFGINIKKPQYYF